MLYEHYPQQNDATNLLKELDNLLEDWGNFFILYAKNAPPPDTNRGDIQTWFKELRGQHNKCIKLYNKTLVRATNTNYGEFSLMYDQPNFNKKDKSSDDTSEDDIGYV